MDARARPQQGRQTLAVNEGSTRGKASPKKKDDVSALSGRTLEQIAEARDAEWQSNRPAVGSLARSQKQNRAAPEPDLSAFPEAQARFIDPMRAKLADTLPEGAEWTYEAKFDGYRALALKTGEGVRILSRNAHELTAEFPSVAQALQSLPDESVVDGELVALDERGMPAFNLLQNRARHGASIQYYIFDLLIFGGRSLLNEPLTRRRELLKSAMAKARAPVLLSEPLTATPKDLIRAVKDLGLEGVLAKKSDSRYESGKRTGSWIKYKVSAGQELVVGGYVPAEKRHFDSLLVGYYRGKQLIFAGKIRNGFGNPGSKEEMFARFKGLGTDTCPFSNLPEPRNARRGMALTAEAMKLCCWLRPKLVVQAGIREWTPEGHLRHARFAGIRDDKDPEDVIRES